MSVGGAGLLGAFKLGDGELAAHAAGVLQLADSGIEHSLRVFLGRKCGGKGERRQEKEMT